MKHYSVRRDGQLVMISDLHIDFDFYNEMSLKERAEVIGDFICQSLNLDGCLSPSAINEIKIALPELHIRMKLVNYEILITCENDDNDVNYTDGYKVGLYLIDPIFDVVEDDPF